MTVTTVLDYSVHAGNAGCCMLVESFVHSSAIATMPICAPASLYKQAGYVSDKADCFWVRLLGLDRRYLMKKHLSERQL